MIKCGVYRITCIENGLIYIGSSKDINQRWYVHKSELRANKHKNMFLQADWNKYGEDAFIFEILENCSPDERYSLEQKYLNELLPFYRTGKGYNISEKSTHRNVKNIRFFKPEDPEDNGYYVVAKAIGSKCRPLLVSMDDYENKTREEIENEIYAMQTYYDIRDYLLETGSYDPDDWD